MVLGLLEALPARLRQHRLLVCAMGALLLHALATLFGKGERLALVESLRADLLQVDIALADSGNPGGGVETPDPNGPERAQEAEEPEAPIKEKVVPRAHPPAPEADALLASAFGASSFLSRVREPKAFVTNRIGSEPRKVAEPPSNSRALQARYNGSGPGSNGGPGGEGAGYGQVTRDFAFGGTSGALRAEMCFIPVGSTSLKKIPNCNGGAVFFTDELNVSDRRFEEGFPGVSQRNEWFTITYGGVFNVKQPGIYQFRLKSDDGSLLFIDNELVIDHDGVHGAISKRGEVDLDEGAHRIVVRYYQGPRYNIALQLYVSPPGKPEQLFHPEL